MEGDYGNGGEMAQDNGQKEEGGYCIEIYVGADNQVKGVKVEQKMMEGGAEMEVEAKMPAKSIDEALSAAKGIYESGGKMDGQMSQESAQDATMRGYGRGSFANQQGGGMGVRKVFSEDM